MKKILYFLCSLCFLVFASGCFCGDPGITASIDFRLPNSTINIFADDTVNYKVDSTKIFFVNEIGELQENPLNFTLLNNDLNNIVFVFDAMGAISSTYLIHWSAQDYDTINIEVNNTKKNMFSCGALSLNLTYNGTPICTNCDPFIRNHLTKKP